MFSEVLVFLACAGGALFFFAIWEEIGSYFASKKMRDNLRLAWILVLGTFFYFIGYR